MPSAGILTEGQFCIFLHILYYDFGSHLMVKKEPSLFLVVKTEYINFLMPKWILANF